MAFHLVICQIQFFRPLSVIGTMSLYWIEQAAGVGATHTGNSIFVEGAESGRSDIFFLVYRRLICDEKKKRKKFFCSQWSLKIAFNSFSIMTVTYSDDSEEINFNWVSALMTRFCLLPVATAKCQTLLKLLLTRWRGSVLKLIWRDLLIYLSLFSVLHVLYHWILDDNQKQVYEKLQQYCRQYEETIPISFVLGFFVTTVTHRWWDQFQVIPWPYSIAVYVSSTLHGYDEVGRAMRRTIMRYVCKPQLEIFACWDSFEIFFFSRFVSHDGVPGPVTTCQSEIPENVQPGWCWTPHKQRAGNHWRARDEISWLQQELFANRVGFHSCQPSTRWRTNSRRLCSQNIDRRAEQVSRFLRLFDELQIGLRSARLRSSRHHCCLRLLRHRPVVASIHAAWS